MAAPRPDNKTYESMISALTSTLDRAAETTTYPLSDTEVALRLARMIWNGEPDQPLRDASAKGRLHDAQALQAQIRRMLSNTRSTALFTGFFDTWLSLDQLTTMKGDSKLFAEFDDELRGAFRRETELFVESQLREDRSSLDLSEQIANGDRRNFEQMGANGDEQMGTDTISGSEAIRERRIPP